MNFLEKMTLEAFARRALNEASEMIVPAAELDAHGIELPALKDLIARYAALPQEKQKFAFEVVGEGVRVRRVA